MYVTVFNPGDTPVAINSKGGTLGGGEWGTADTLDDVASEAIDSERLLKVGDGGDTASSDEGARAALEQTARYGERADQIGELDKPALERAAKKGGLLTEGEDVPLRDELADLLVRSDVDLPKPKSTPKKSE